MAFFVPEKTGGSLSSLENALRTALAKGDASNSAFRKKVYEAAAAAMHRQLSQKGEADPAAFQLQRERLTAAIRVLEAEHAKRPATSPAPDAPIPTVDRPVTPARSEPVVEPPVRENAAPKRAAGQEPQLVAEPRPETVKRETRAAPPPEPKRRAPFATMFAVAVAAAIVVVGLVWVFTTGAFQSAEERDTSVPNPPASLDSESFEGRDPGTANAPANLSEQAETEGDWVTLFQPSDLTTLGLYEGATAEAASDPFGDYARIVTPQGSAVQIDIPPGVLNTLAGRSAQVAITARSDEGQTTQMAVTCEFATGEGCARLRFNVGQAENEYLVRVDVPENPGQGLSSLVIVTDVDAGEKAVKLLGVRIRPFTDG